MKDISVAFFLCRFLEGQTDAGEVQELSVDPLFVEAPANTCLVCRAPSFQAMFV